MAQGEKRDLVERRARWLVWGVPFLLVVVGAFVEPGVRVWFWAPSFAVAGTACVLNAATCGRMHCTMTGPLFLVAATVSVLESSGIIAVGWTLIGVGVVVSACIAYQVEWIRGKYVRTRSACSRATAGGSPEQGKLR